MSNKRKEGIKKDVIKHSAAVHIQNNITLLQRRAWNVLLASAYDELPVEEEHRIRVQNLMYMLEFDSKNENYLKEALEALVGCKVEWNVLDKDGEHEWGVTTLLAQAKIARGTCIYAYSPELRRRLHNPSMYARISLSMQNKFESKHAQALWELCVDYLGAVRDYGETPFIPLDTYRKLMGIADDLYPMFKLFNRRVIKDPLDEINRVTDFRVSVDYRRESRRVTALKFKIYRVLLLPEPGSKQGMLFPDLNDMPIVVKELKGAGLSAKDAWELWQHGFEGVDEDARPRDVGADKEAAFTQYIREKIHLLKRQASGKVGSSTGFLLKAIKRNYANPLFAEEAQRQAALERQQAERARARTCEALREHIAALRRDRDHAIRARCKEIITDDLAEEAIQALLTTKSGVVRRWLLPDATALENYRTSSLLWFEVDRYLEQRYPERFTDLHASCDAQLAPLAERLTVLEHSTV